MQKPDKQAIKDFIIERTSEELEISQETVETVISWSYKKANEASHRVKEIELSGIGTLKLSQAKLRKQIEKLERIISHLTDETKLESVTKTLEELKTKRSE